MGVVGRQQRQGDLGIRGGGDALLRHLGPVGIGAAPWIVVEIVELTDRGEAVLEHLHVGHRGERALEGVGVEVGGARFSEAGDPTRRDRCGGRLGAEAGDPARGVDLQEAGCVPAALAPQMLDLADRGPAHGRYSR